MEVPAKARLSDPEPVRVCQGLVEIHTLLNTNLAAVKIIEPHRRRKDVWVGASLDLRLCPASEC